MAHFYSAAYETISRWTVWCTQLRFRLDSHGQQRLPAHGAVLLLANPLNQRDRAVLQGVCPKPIHFLNPDHPEAIVQGQKLLEKGQVVCLSAPAEAIPHLTQLVLPPGWPALAQIAHTSIIPVWVDRIWNQIWVSRHRHIYFGHALTTQPRTDDQLQSALLGLGVRALEDQPALQAHVGTACLHGLRQNFFSDVITDAYQNGRTLTGGQLLAVSMVFAKWLRRHVPEKRLGLVLPPGLGVSIANLACALANKTPVNLNFTAGRAAIQSAMNRSEIQQVLTAQAMMEKARDFPWPEAPLDLPTILRALPAWRIKLAWLQALLLPTALLRRALQLPERGDKSEAALLFTSGSAGEPKGVVLSHRNILANVAQIKAVFWQKPIEAMLGCLPIFHSFGCTVTFWWPLLGGPRIVTYPSPMETATLAATIEKYGISVFINTPTFLRAYLRKAKPEQLRSVRVVVTGAEKCPLDLMEEFETKFKVPICEGFGMTEATPVVAVNLLTNWNEGIQQRHDSGRRRGSVGPLLPGLTVQIRDPETDTLLPLNQSGMLWLKGANIFGGYLNDTARTQTVLREGWYKTGDIGRLDPDGFLFIEGRLSRFSKVAGEMVPHGVIEEAMRKILGTQDEESLSLLVVGIPDPIRGEELVILTTRDFDWGKLSQALSAAGLPNLWIPKILKKVEKIPLLATGKLDLRACQELASS